MSLSCIFAGVIALCSFLASSAVWAADGEKLPKSSMPSESSNQKLKPDLSMGYKITQVSRNHGEFVTYATPTFVRAVNVPGNCEFISSAPDWKVWVVNTESKRYFCESLSRWMASGLCTL